MTVEELMAQLQKLKPTAKVIVSLNDEQFWMVMGANDHMVQYADTDGEILGICPVQMTLEHPESYVKASDNFCVLDIIPDHDLTF